MQKFIILVIGPTAVGKSDVAQCIAQHLSGEILNADMAQIYRPLSIGTAKPSLSNVPVPHHLFDYIQEPRSITAYEFRQRVAQLVPQIWERNRIPVIVGGSGFYVKALLYPPHVSLPLQNINRDEFEYSWDMLNQLDPKRAALIKPTDSYRINRALDIIYSTGQKASSFVPQYQPIAPYILINVMRERTDLYGRINMRTAQMLKEGWLAEVSSLKGTEWEQFLYQKKIIGYDDLLRFLDTQQTPAQLEQITSTITQKTRNYAKRQMSFNRNLIRSLEDENKVNSSFEGIITECNLTLNSINLCLEHLDNQIKVLIKKL